MSNKNSNQERDLQEILLEIATDYQAEFDLNKDAKQSNNPVIKLIEKEMPKWIETAMILDNQQSYKIKGSAGNGKMSFIPWIAIMDTKITTSATKGCYLVYLLSLDRQRIYLSFGIGAQELVKKGTKFTQQRIELMQEVIHAMRQKIHIPISVNLSELHLRIDGDKLPYEVGTVCSKEYHVSNLPTNDELVEDLKQMLEIYNEYVASLSEEEAENLNIGGYVMPNLNTILYGPPGTGKTYRVIEKAVNIIDQNFSDVTRTREEYEEAYRTYIENKQIQFCTFHQSFSYEDFVEGLRSDIEKEGAPFTPQNGVFKEICELAKSRYQLSKSSTTDIDQRNIYKISLGQANSIAGEKIYRYCIDNKLIALGHGSEIDFTGKNNLTEVSESFAEYEEDETSNSVIKMVNNFKNELQIGDIVIVSKGNLKFRAIAKVTGEYFYDEESEIPYNHFRKVEWLFISNNGEEAEHIFNSNFTDSTRFSQLSIYPFGEDQLNIEAIKNFINPNENGEEERFVLIIDEINRGNISKIFGELITLIEEDKRFDVEADGTIKGLEVTLPYSKEKFSVPKNVYILGTMNTADRSISLMDTALRRRFDFEEMLPEPNVLSEVDGIDVQKLLRKVNQRIEYLYDRDHQIGHAFFIGKESSDELIEVIQRKVIPLLQEYFYDDWEKIELVLGGAAKSEGIKNDYFLFKQTLNANNLFNKTSKIQSKKVIYSVVKEPSAQALLNIYEDESITRDE